MDFYAAQDQARRNSRWLVVWFLLAVILLIGITNVIVAMFVFVIGTGGTAMAAPDAARAFLSAFNLETFGFVCLGVLGTIFVVILFKWAQLSAGGKAVAERLGGERILPHTSDSKQRRCLNVVEEMALAAGIPVPPVYLLARERGINAFAAGISPADAVIGVTQGSLNTFNREQLQGVIAHELSHILNGDMRLNIRLAAMLKGITFIGDVGELIVRGGSRRRYGASDRKSKVPAQAVVLGIALWLIGLLGGLFAGFIKAAVSRQREHLADASAVQFTRNPGGVADALKVIGGYPAGTTVTEARAVELSHIFFGQIAGHLWQFFHTHPPLPERIRRIEPGWDGQYIRFDPSQHYEGTPQDQARRAQREKAARAAAAAVLAGTVLAEATGAADAEFATEAQLDQAVSPMHGIPDDLAQQARDPFGANAIVFGLLLARDEAVRERQYGIVEAAGVRGLATATRQVHARLETIAPEWRLSLLELCLPALKCISAKQYRAFKETLLKITGADNQVDLYE